MILGALGECVLTLKDLSTEKSEIEELVVRKAVFGAYKITNMITIISCFLYITHNNMIRYIFAKKR
jgi:hypothetical protein